MTNARILLVDDEPNVLAGYKRHLRRDFIIDIAESGPQALDMLQGGPRYAVIVSDMRMPGMDGITLLGDVRKHAPDTVRMMLTGNADLETCIKAVNQGQIFRFLTKPCQPEDLALALAAGVEQYRLVTAEHELVHGTLAGVLRTLTDLLGLLNPAAFSRASRIRRYVRHLAAELNATHFWEYEIAAALSQIGLIALPPDILTRIREGRSLTSHQRGTVMRHPLVGCQLLAEIPRFELVALVIQKQHLVARRPILPTEVKNEAQVIDFGAQMLRVAMDLDDLVQRKLPFIDALTELQRLYGPDHPMVEALMSYDKDADRVRMEVTASELSSGMVTACDIMSDTGRVLVSKGTWLSEPLIVHLQSCAQAGGLLEPFPVDVVSGEAGPQRAPRL
jgi:CheY-like chemotaxis protein